MLRINYNIETMYTYKLKTAAKNTREVDIEIPKDTIDKEYKTAFNKIQRELTVEGFRKGKVPDSVAQKHIKKDTVYQELFRTLMPAIYEEIVKKEGIRPIISPKIELVKAKEGEAWELKITIAEKPVVYLDGYKEIVKKVKDQHKKPDIWVPGKSKEKQEKETDSKDKQLLLNEILNALIEKVKVEISDLIQEDELNRRLTQLVDDVQKIGLTVEAYLKSKNLTMDQLKARYTKEISETYKMEFILTEIADKEQIKVEQAEIDKLLSAIKNEKDRKKASDNAYYYAMILRKQKTLDYLLSL